MNGHIKGDGFEVDSGREAQEHYLCGVSFKPMCNMEMMEMLAATLDANINASALDQYVTIK